MQGPDQRRPGPERPEKPFLIRVAPWIIVPYSLAGLAFSGLMIAEYAGGASIGPFTDIVGAAPVIIAFSFALHAALAIASYGLYKERTWSRWILTAGLLVICSALMVGLGALTSFGISLHVSVEIAGCLALILVSIWYFFRKPNVRRYFRHLAS